MPWYVVPNVCYIVQVWWDKIGFRKSLVLQVGFGRYLSCSAIHLRFVMLHQNYCGTCRGRWKQWEANEGPGVKDIWALVVRDPKSPALKASELLKVTDFA